jgi:hypothetical protein
VSIHSHPIDSWLEGNLSASFPADVPSPAREDGTGGDKKVFSNYSTNIIVGKNGLAESNGKYDEFDKSKINYTLKDNRTPKINVFDSKANKVGTLSGQDAQKIIGNEEKSKK